MCVLVQDSILESRLTSDLSGDKFGKYDMSAETSQFVPRLPATLTKI